MELSPQAQQVVESGLRRAIVGTPTEAADQVRAPRRRVRRLTEVMVKPRRVGEPRY